MIQIVDRAINYFTSGEAKDDLLDALILPLLRPSPLLAIPFAVGGCAPHAPGAGSTFAGRTEDSYVAPDPDAMITMPMGQFVIVDNGDGVYHQNDPSDFVLLKDGSMASMNHPDVKAYLKGIGIDEQPIFGLKLKNLSDYIAAFEISLPAIRDAQDEATIKQSYEELEDAARGIGAYIDVGSTLYERIIEVVGRNGCYIPLFSAEGSSANGYVESMDAALEGAQSCFSSNGGVGDLESRIGVIRMDGFKNAISGVTASKSNNGYIDSMDESLAKIEKLAKEDGILSALAGDLFKSRQTGYLAAIKGVYTNQGRNGYLESANEKLIHIMELSKGTEMFDDVDEKFWETFKESCLAANDGIMNNQGRNGYIDSMDEKLEKVKEVIAEMGDSARKLGLKIPDSLTEEVNKALHDTRVKSYLIAINSIFSNQGRNGYIDSATEKMTHILEVSKEYGAFGDISDKFWSTTQDNCFAAIEGAFNGSGRNGYYESMDEKLDNVQENFDAVSKTARGLRLETPSATSAAVRAKIRGSRIDSYMVAIKNVSNGSARHGYVDSTREKLAEIEKSAKQYGIWDDIKDEVASTIELCEKNARRS